jgi:hypothetical protein
MYIWQRDVVVLPAYCYSIHMHVNVLCANWLTNVRSSEVLCDLYAYQWQYWMAVWILTCVTLCLLLACLFCFAEQHVYYSRLRTGHVYLFMAYSMYILFIKYIYIFTHISKTRIVFLEACSYLKMILKNVIV